MSRIGKIIIWGLVGVLIAVISYFVNQLIKVKNADWAYNGVKIKTLLLNKVEFIVFMKMINPGMATVTVSNQKYDIYLNGRPLAHLKNLVPFVIKPGINIMPIEVNLDPGDIVKAGWVNLSNILTNRSKVNITVTGTYDLNIGFIKIREVSLNENFNMGSTPEAESNYDYKYKHKHEQHEHEQEKTCACPSAPPGVKDDWCWCVRK